MDSQPMGSVIVGVVPGQPDILLTSAGEFARRFRVALVCVHVDRNRSTADEHADGSVQAVPRNWTPCGSRPSELSGT